MQYRNAIRSGSAFSLFILQLYNVYDAINSEEMALLQKTKSYILPVLEKITDVYITSSKHTIVSFQSNLRTFTAVFLSVFLVAMLAVYLPSVRKLQRDVHSKQSMLVLLPVEVVRRTPAVERLVRVILQEVEASSGSAAGSHDDLGIDAIAGVVDKGQGASTAGETEELGIVAAEGTKRPAY